MRRKHKMAMRRLREDLDVAKNANAYLLKRWENLSVEVRDLRIRVRDLEPKLPEPDEDMLRAAVMKQIKKQCESIK